MTDVFEVDRYDAAGRLGELEVPRAGVTVETPALLPVINPHLQTVTPAQLESEFGAEILITNSYVLYGSEDLRDPVEQQGLHDLLDFSGAIVTDSGSTVTNLSTRDYNYQTSNASEYVSQLQSLEDVRKDAESREPTVGGGSGGGGNQSPYILVALFALGAALLYYNRGDTDG